MKIELPGLKDESFTTTASNTSRSDDCGSMSSSLEPEHFLANDDKQHRMPDPSWSGYPCRLSPSVFWQDSTAAAEEEVRGRCRQTLEPVESYPRPPPGLWPDVTTSSKVDLNDRRECMPVRGWRAPATMGTFATQGREQMPLPKKENRRGNANRKKSDLTTLNPPPSNYASITTLMIRGIPCGFSQEDLLSLLAGAGLADHVNFFYLPKSGNTASNLGYAFINFTETIHAWTCAFAFDGMHLDPARSAKVCSISPADIQGITNLRKHFRRAAVCRGLNGPLFLGDKKNDKLKDLMRRVKELKDEAC